MLAGLFSIIAASPSFAQGAPGTSLGANSSIPWWGYCIWGTAFGPIYATLRLNKQLKNDEAYTSMSWCGLGSFWLVYNQKYKPR